LLFWDYYGIIADNMNMKAEGYTAKELAELLDISYENVRKRIEKAGIKPITKKLYTRTPH
jgi:DNA-binding CsgD family transcriptional regulator